MTTTGQQIRDARERAGLTQEQLAQRVGVTLRTVGNWERGASVPRNRLARIREVLPDLDRTDDRGVNLRTASDVEVLAEIARRFARGQEGGGEHVRSAPNTRAGDPPAYRATEVEGDEAASRSPAEVASQQPKRGRPHPDLSG